MWFSMYFLANCWLAAHFLAYIVFITTANYPATSGHWFWNVVQTSLQYGKDRRRRTCVVCSVCFFLLLLNINGSTKWAG